MVLRAGFGFWLLQFLMLAYVLLLNKMRVVSTLTLSFAYSLILINLNDEGKIMGKNDYPGVLGWGEVNKTNLAILRQ